MLVETKQEHLHFITTIDLGLLESNSSWLSGTFFCTVLGKWWSEMRSWAHPESRMLLPMSPAVCPMYTVSWNQWSQEPTLYSLRPLQPAKSNPLRQSTAQQQMKHTVLMYVNYNQGTCPFHPRILEKTRTLPSYGIIFLWSNVGN